MSRTLRSRVVIDAARSRVWEILTDFPRYPDWNPYYVHVDGDLAKGARLRLQVRLGSSDALTPASVTITEIEPGARLSWRSRFLAPGLLTGVHSFELGGADGEVTLGNLEHFTGILVPISGSSLAAVQSKLDELSRAVSARAEA